MYDMVKNAGIGLYAIHTNADYAPNSLAYMQALAIDLENVEQSAGNQSVTGFLREPSTVEELSDLLKVTLQLEEVEFRSNIGPNEPVHKITISSGAAGEYGINSQDPEALHIVGEVKHHE
jgi:putative NIF3 family GTP cyclohydrolase 1 type 2